MSCATRPCDTCGNLVRGRLLHGASILGPMEYGREHCTQGHDPDVPPQTCEDYSRGRPMSSDEYARETYWMCDERV